MRGILNKLLLTFEQPLQLVEHLVEHGGQVNHLGARIHIFEPPSQIAPADLPRAVCYVIDRSERLADYQRSANDRCRDGYHVDD